jgi:hypothetical protein
MQNLTAEDLKGFYDASFQKGREVAEGLWKSREEATKSAPGQAVVDTLERLGNLRESGVISEEEFERLKAAALGDMDSDGTRPPASDDD